MDDIIYTRLQIPVYVPYSDGTRVVIGNATVSSNGLINIELTKNAAGLRITEMITDGLLHGLSFDYVAHKEALPSDDPDSDAKDKADE
jgi:hypothetical protein